jgi:UDP-N-acetylmuramoyl-tripeptide--D-alanyl-D-alanine ligase
MRTRVQPGFPLAELLTLLGAELLAGDAGASLSALSTDTRALEPGDYFLALTGARFDGHEFVPAAFERGAGGAIVERGAGRRLLARLSGIGGKAGRPVLGVDDPLAALQTLAAAHRRRFHLPVIGITGSNGKTTTKEMTAAILSRRYAVLKSRGNLNSQIGLPLAVLGLTAEHAAAVFELGISQRGELTRLCRMAGPTIGVITNIGPAHTEFLGDLDGVRAAKAELLEALPVDGVAVLNRDDAAYDWLRQRCRCRTVGFGLSTSADVRVVIGSAGPSPKPSPRLSDNRPVQPVTLEWARGRAEVILPLVGAHNAANAAAATAAALEVGVGPEEIVAGLQATQLPAMRSDWRRLPGGVRLLLDAYNANPVSVRRAMETAAQQAGGGRVAAFLGDMLELGPSAVRYHREIGEVAAALGLFRLVTVGPLAAAMADGAAAAGLPAGSMHRCDTLDEARALLAAWLERGELRAGDVVLVKGSRSTRMERLVENLTERED